MKISDNVISFPTRAGRESEKAQGEKVAEEKRAASDRIRATLMRQKLTDKPRINKESDRIRIAKNLSLILNEMKATGYKASKLLRDLDMGTNGDSTKQLRNYALPENATLESSSTHIRVLTKTAAKYLRIAEGASKAMRSDAFLIVLRLFENTSYQVNDDVPDEKIASMDQIRELLVGMADAAVRRNDLKYYLEVLESRRVGWDIDGSFGNYRSLAYGVFFRDRAARHVSYLGYAPTVFLYRRDVSPVMPIEGEAFQIDFEKDQDAVTSLLRENKPLPKKYRMPVRLSISREIWFGIAPMESDWTWKPVFEKRLSFHVCGYQDGDRSLHVSSYDPTIMLAAQMHDGDAPDRLHWLHQFTLPPRSRIGAGGLSLSVSPHIDTSESVRSEDVQRDNLEDRWLIALDRFDNRSLSVDEDIDTTQGQFFYEAVNLESCVKHLDHVADPNDSYNFEDECASVELNNRLWPGLEETEAWYQDFSMEGWPAMHVVSPKGSIARAIEQNLLRRDTADRLDSVLFETVTERVQSASEYYQCVLQNREDRVTRLLHSWKKV